MAGVNDKIYRGLRVDRNNAAGVGSVTSTTLMGWYVNYSDGCLVPSTTVAECSDEENGKCTNCIFTRKHKDILLEYLVEYDYLTKEQALQLTLDEGLK